MKLYAPFIIVMLTISVHAMEDKKTRIEELQAHHAELSKQYKEAEEQELELKKQEEELCRRKELLRYKLRDAQVLLEACKRSETKDEARTTPDSSNHSLVVSTATPIAPTQKGWLSWFIRYSTTQNKN